MTPVEQREYVSRVVEDLLDRHNGITGAQRCGDRLTFMYEGMACELIVSATTPIACVPHDTCPFCGSKRFTKSDEDSDTFFPRRGCLDCNNWIDPVRLKNP